MSGVPAEKLLCGTSRHWSGFNCVWMEVRVGVLEVVIQRESMRKGRSKGKEGFNAWFQMILVVPKTAVAAAKGAPSPVSGSLTGITASHCPLGGSRRATSEGF